MRFKILIIGLFFLFSFTSVFATENTSKKITNKVYSIGSGFIKGILGSEGDTEVLITTGEELKPMGSIMIVRPIKKMNNGIFFSQSQINNYYVQGKERQAINLGFGQRILSSDHKYFSGYNFFVDSDSKANTRFSFGLEFYTDPFKIHGNLYQKLSGTKQVSGNNERVLNGYDFNMIGQVPYLPWANINFNNYKWDSIKNSGNSKGDKFSLNLLMTPNLLYEVGYDKNALYGTSNFFKVTFVYPPKNKPSLSTKPFGDMAFEKSDVSDDLLTKVIRVNKIVVELEGAVTVKGF